MTCLGNTMSLLLSIPVSRVVKKKTIEPCKEQTSGAQKVAKGDISFSFADKLAA